MSDKHIAVLVVDDSAFMRNVISKLINATEDLEVVATAMNGKFALKKLETIHPDVILLDLEMPEMTGIQFLEERKRRGIETPVVILSSIAHRGARITMEALALGASDFLLKPSGSDASELRRIEDQITTTVRAYALRFKAQKKIDTPSRPTVGDDRTPGMSREPRTGVPEPFRGGDAFIAARTRIVAVKAVAIGISTGGPNALRQLVRELDPQLPVPVFIVQHMPAAFTHEFAESLNKLSALEVKEAEEGDIVRPGRIFIAPGDKHMKPVRRRLAVSIALSDQPPVSGHRPSVDVLFRASAEAYGASVMAIIMTGMGKDGAEAIGEVKRSGGITIGQDEESSVVYGMPRVAAEAGHLNQVLPLDRIADFVNRIARG